MPLWKHIAESVPEDLALYIDERIRHASAVGFNPLDYQKNIMQDALNGGGRPD
jgi:hypothetical protein